MAPKFLIAVVAAMCMTATSFAQSPAVPPNDAAQYSIVVLTRDVPCQYCVRLQAIMTSPEVTAIAKNCKVFYFATTSPIYRTRYAGAIPPDQAPAILLVRPDGGVLYKASGPAIPDAKELAAAFTKQATLDRSLTPQPPRHTMSHDWSQEPLIERPRLIPDTVVVRPVIAPTVNVAAPNIIFIVIVGLIFLACVGAVPAFIVLALFLARR